MAKPVFGSLVGGTFGLGVWQTHRYHWKTQLIEERRHKLALPPTSLDASEDHRRVTVSGVFLQEQTRVGPRSSGVRVQGLSTAPQGYEVVTVLNTGDRRILVNRGWVPRGMEVPPPPPGVVRIVGMVGGEQKRMFSPVNVKNQVLWLDVEFLAKLLGTEEVLVTLVDDDSTWPRSKTLAQFMTFPVDPPTHAAYAATWFTLSVFGFFMTRRLLRVVPKKKR